MPFTEEQYKENIRKFYKVIGADEGKCKGCGRTIWWVRTRHKKNAPYTDEGINHSTDCKEAAKWR